MEKSARPRTALNECVKVVVRCRPLSEREKNEGHDEVVRVWAERGAVQVYNPKGQDKLFTYDAAYDCTADTQTIYDEMVRPLVASVLDGFNGCVFAYGQTGTGKTHTMEGTPDHEGIIPRAFRHIWTHIENNASPDITHLVSCSYVELYLEDVRDLLSKDCKKLTIRGQELNGFYIPEMTSVVCKSAAEMVRAMRAGNRNRAAARTDMNEHSSRSHAVFLVTVETAHRTTNRIRCPIIIDRYVGRPPSAAVGTSGCDPAAGGRAGGLRSYDTCYTLHLKDGGFVLIRTVLCVVMWSHCCFDNYRFWMSVGKLNLVDLAGSERQRKTGAGGERLREAARINQALSSLGNVISALAENSPHVPYRDSKLTRILQDSLGGNSKTIMIANIGPASYNYDETITTLRYAHRAKAIKNKPVRNEDPKDAKLREYQAEIERLRALIEQRRKRAARPRAPRAPAPAPAPAPADHEHSLAESTIEQEKTKTEELEHQIRALEERLVQGGGGKDLLNNLNETQIILEQRNMEIAERKKREVEMQQKIDLEEETTAIVTNTFATLQQEVDHKTQRLKKCLSKYTCLREEMVEQREAHDAERREHEALQAALIAELRRRLLLADSFVPEAGRATVLRLRYNEDADAWELPAHAADPPPARPRAAPAAARTRCWRCARCRCRPPRAATCRPPPPPPAAARPGRTPRYGARRRRHAMDVVSKKEVAAESRRMSARRAPSAHPRLGTAGVR
ncbi:unnamed protein product, partial [Brenthis ino]